MPYQVYFENHLLMNCDYAGVALLKKKISQEYGVHENDLVATIHGKRVADDYNLKSFSDVVRIWPKLVGGKGGFGSMLRAIGAQIEKTTNREACRDLSGRRIRDINEERRLRKWLEGRPEREREAKERKQKKIQSVIAGPVVDLESNSGYDKQREELPEKVSAAIDAGWHVAGPSGNDSGVKRKAEVETVTGQKKAKLWIDADITDCSSLSEDEEDVEIRVLGAVSTDSGNESDRTIDSSKKVYHRK